VRVAVDKGGFQLQFDCEGGARYSLDEAQCALAIAAVRVVFGENGAIDEDRKRARGAGSWRALWLLRIRVL
jgi:hypothetical protein